MPLPYIERCLQLYSVPGDVVLDPFSGIGSTGYQSVKMLRKFVGSELKPEYAKQAARFISEGARSMGELFS
jgi:DNA modification methylase